VSGCPLPSAQRGDACAWQQTSFLWCCCAAGVPDLCSHWACVLQVRCGMSAPPCNVDLFLMRQLAVQAKIQLLSRLFPEFAAKVAHVTCYTPCTSASLLAQVTPQSWEGARGQRCSVSPRASICSVTRPCVSGMGLTVCKSCRRAGASLIAIPLPILFRFTWMSHVAVVSASLHLDRFCLRHDGIHYSVVVAGCASQACV
jgi:hypothetical protein